MRLHIEPLPPPDEAAAIEQALTKLLERYGLGEKRRLRYGDVTNVETMRAHLDAGAYRWSDVARIEALEGRPNDFNR